MSSFIRGRLNQTWQATIIRWMGLGDQKGLLGASGIPKFFRLILGWYRERLTLSGRAILLGMLISLVLGTTASVEIPIYLVWCGATALLITALLISFFFRPQVQAIRRLPRHVRAGERIQYEVQLVNVSKRPAWSLEIEESGLPQELKPVSPEPIRLRQIPPQGEQVVSLGLECNKRGVYTLAPVAVSSSFPSGLFKARCRNRNEQSLMIYPYFKRLSDFPLPTGRRYQPGGLTMTSDVGDSTEFLCTREYRPGDSIREIHWASWARTGKPVVKVFQEEYFVRLAMLLDSEVRNRDDRAFEAGISLAASVADVLSRKDYIIDIFAAGEEIFRFQAGRALAHFDNILQILACITHVPQVDTGKVLRALSPEASRLSALVCILMDWDEKRRILVHALRAVGLGTRTIVVKAEAPTLSIQGEPDLTWCRPDEVLQVF